jgi:hypothetical protein
MIRMAEGADEIFKKIIKYQNIIAWNIKKKNRRDMAVLDSQQQMW